MKLGRFILTLIAIPLMIGLVKLMWALTIPPLFPGAVSKGLIASDISWVTTIKLCVFAIVMGMFVSVRK